MMSERRSRSLWVESGRTLASGFPETFEGLELQPFRNPLPDSERIEVVEPRQRDVEVGRGVTAPRLLDVGNAGGRCRAHRARHTRLECVGGDHPVRLERGPHVTARGMTDAEKRRYAGWKRP